jgi:hypothetical protein
MMTGVFAAITTTSAKNYDGIIPTYAYVTAAPDPVGLGQTVYISMFIDKVAPTATGVGGDRWQNFALTITSPSGKVTHLGPFTADAAGGSTNNLCTRRTRKLHSCTLLPRANINRPNRNRSNGK